MHGAVPSLAQNGLVFQTLHARGASVNHHRRVHGRISFETLKLRQVFLSHGRRIAASVRGFEIQKAISEGGDRAAITTRLNQAVWTSAFLMTGIVLYLGVGVFNLVVWLGNSEVAPEMIGAFALGILGWLAGAFSAAFRT
jgi:hypothetical protein